MGILTTDLKPKLAMEECNIEVQKLKFMVLQRDLE